MTCSLSLSNWARSVLYCSIIVRICVGHCIWAETSTTAHCACAGSDRMKATQVMSLTSHDRSVCISDPPHEDGQPDCRVVAFLCESLVKEADVLRGARENRNHV